MHVSLSDLLVCPRCGPEWGLILLPDEVLDRRVASGVLGCANCRSRYPVRRGVAELGVGEPLAGEAPWRPEDGATRVAGVLGLAERRGVVLLAGGAAAHAAAVAALAEDVEVLSAPGVASGEAEEAADEPTVPVEPGVTRIEVGETLPIRTGALSGAALTGAATALAADAARALGPGARLLLDPAGPAAREALAAAGLRVLAEEGEALVAGR